VSEGIPLSLTFLVSQVNDAGCVPLPGAQVDIWHCDVQGVYSGVNDPGFSTANQDFLRGYLVTDENGAARFDTIYPGWYPGRAVHIHFKIRTDPQAAQGYDFTSQLFFEDSLNGDVFARSPYAGRGDGWLRNERDGIFQNSGGQLTLHPEENDGGFNATFDIGLQI
jgi:protocatechuate 3,4-dioxygenase beta subunit